MRAAGGGSPPPRTPTCTGPAAGSDFWPGEYSKTYVDARQDYADIMDGLRTGRIFVTTGDLITGLDVTATHGRHVRDGRADDHRDRHEPGHDVDIEIRFTPAGGRERQRRPSAVHRVDLIVGQVTGPVSNRDAATNASTTKVVARYGTSDCRRQGDEYVIRHTLRDVTTSRYVRVRGTSTDEMEPARRRPGEPLGRPVVLLQPGLHRRHLTACGHGLVRCGRSPLAGDDRPTAMSKAQSSPSSSEPLAGGAVPVVVAPATSGGLRSIGVMRWAPGVPEYASGARLTARAPWTLSSVYGDDI